MKSFTLRVDESTYNEYAAVALLDGKNVTTALRQHMEDVANHRLPKQDLEKINAQVDDVLKKIVNDEIIDLLAKRVAERLGVPSSRKIVSEIPLVSKNDNNTVILDRNDGSTLSRIEDTNGIHWISDRSNQVEILEVSEVSFPKANDQENPEDEKIDNNYNLSDRSDTQAEESSELEPEKNKNGSERKRKTRNLRTFSDGEVAIAEAKSAETIRRYRTGQRNPRDKTFCERWQVCDWNDKRWVKIQD